MKQTVSAVTYRSADRVEIEATLLYPREPHGLREEGHLPDRLNRIIAWYDEYLKPALASIAQQP
jgi:hypothetical protein